MVSVALPIKSARVVEDRLQETEIGKIPLEWDVIRIGDVGNVIRGASPRPKGDKRYYGGDIPRLMVEDVTRDGKFVTPQVDFLTGDGAKLSRPCKAGTLTIVCSGTVGVPSFLNVDACIHDGFLAVVGIKERYDSDYLYHQINKLRAKLDSAATHGGVFTNLTTTGVKDFSIAIPRSKDEQKSIANALSDTDALISSLEQLIEKKRQTKYGAMQELLSGKRRLEGFTCEWSKKSFGDIFDFLSTATNSRSDLREDESAYYVHYGDIHTRFHSHLDFRSQQPSRIERSKCKNAALIKNGDWIMADASEDLAGVGKCIEIAGLRNEDQAVSGLHTFLLREKRPTFVQGFKGHLGNLKSLHSEYMRVMTGMKVFGVSKTALKNLMLPVPSEKEQREITAILNDMDAEIRELEAKAQKVRHYKQGMVQELLAGRIRLV